MGSTISLAIERNSEESDTLNYKNKNIFVSQGNYQLIQLNITYIQPADTHWIHPTTESPKHFGADLIYPAPKSTILYRSFNAAAKSINYIYSSSPQIHRRTKIFKTTRLMY